MQLDELILLRVHDYFSWDMNSGKLVQICAGVNEVWGVNDDDEIYVSNSEYYQICAGVNWYRSVQVLIGSDLRRFAQG